MSVAFLSTDPFQAEIVTAMVFAVGLVFAVNVADVVPGATVTLYGTVTRGLMLDRRITRPPAGAGPLSTTVPVDELPPFTVVGDNVNETKAGGLTVNIADTLLLA